ncbi:MAG TPA: knotted carbamoyltransferase YgeW [Vicinamibacterales bacterium]
MVAQLRPKIAALGALGHELFNKDVLLTWECRDATLRAILLTAEILEDLARLGISGRTFESGLGVAIFRDKSTRTRYSFRAACNLLGLATEELDESTSQIAHGETVRETAAMVGFLSEVIGIRDDMFLGEGHKYQTDVAASLDDSFTSGVLMQRPAVINLQSDLDHPTQSLADLRHLVAHFGSLEALRGKKIAMSWAYSPSYGKPLSVPQGVIGLMTRFGMHVALAHPPGYGLVPDTLAVASTFARESGGSFSEVDSMEAAFDGADIVYPKSWASMSIMEERTRLFRANDRAALAGLERQALHENARYRDWECTAHRMRATRGGTALYMHCLPADVSGVSCEAGEVSRDVFERARLDTYREASHKPFVIAAMILNTRFPGAAAALMRRVDEARTRRGHA